MQQAARSIRFAPVLPVPLRCIACFSARIERWAYRKTLTEKEKDYDDT